MRMRFHTALEMSSSNFHPFRGIPDQLAKQTKNTQTTLRDLFSRYQQREVREKWRLEEDAQKSWDNQALRTSYVSPHRENEFATLVNYMRNYFISVTEIARFRAAKIWKNLINFSNS